MTTAHTQTTPASALRLLAQILQRYDSLDAFLLQLRRELEDPTVVMPRLIEDHPGYRAYSAGSAITTPRPARRGRHARTDD